MMTTHLAKFRVCDANDHTNIADLIYSIRDEFFFSERCVADEMADLLFERGGAVGGYVNGQLIGLGGFFFGQASDNYTDRTTALVYLACIDKRYRSTGAFGVGLVFMVHALHQLGVEHIRLHAQKSNKRLNAIYSGFAKPLRIEPNRRGIDCVLYGNTVEAILMQLPQRYPAQLTKTQAVHSQQRVGALQPALWSVL